MVKKSKMDSSLVELIYDQDIGLFAYGDDVKRPIPAQPIHAPLVIENIPVGTPYSKKLRLFEQRAPPRANAFILGEIVPGYEESREYACPIQYCMISDANWRRASDLKKEDWVFGGFFPWG